MKEKRSLAIALVTATGLAVAVAGFQFLAPSESYAQQGGQESSQQGDPMRKAGWGGHRWGGRHGGGMRMLCSDRRDERLGEVKEFVESFVDFTPPQADAWTKLTAAVDAGSAKVGTTCASLKEQGRPETAPDKLARMQTMMTTGLDILNQIKPAFDDFYATLDERQKAAIDKLTSRRGRRM